MASVTQLPCDYLLSPSVSFWRWTQDSEAIVWAETGDTIVFRRELEQILRVLANGGPGLPPLSVVLLVVAACRDFWVENLRRQGGLVAMLPDNGLAESEFAALDAGLTRISWFAPQLRHPIEAKSQLLQFLFETGGTCCETSMAVAVCDALLSLSVPDASTLALLTSPRGNLRQALKQMLVGLGRLDEQAFQLRLTTGLDELVQPAVLPLTEERHAGDLVSLLRDDPEYGALARLARSIMAAVHLPRPLLEPQELPLGGFSDLENRGSLDRLLVSELAHDDLTLAVRIALNEALYLRREIPPQTPALSRSILIDVGIRMWGIPRVFAAAVALALAATTDRHVPVDVYRAKGSAVESVDLTTRQGLIEHLAQLTEDAHPGRAVAAWLEASRPSFDATDRIIVTSVEAAADRTFQECLARQPVPGLYLATVRRSGQFQLHYQGLHGRKLICEAELKLEELLSQTGRRYAPVLTDSCDHPLPAIFHARPFPLLVPCNTFNEHRSWAIANRGVFEIAQDSRLLWWTSPHQGPQQIVATLSVKGSICWCDDQLRDNETLAVLHQFGSGYELLCVNVKHRTVSLNRLAHLSSSSRHATCAFCCHAGTLVAITGDRMLVYNRNGTPVVELTLRIPPSARYTLRRRAGRFFYDSASGAWYAATYDGAEARLDQVFNPASHPGVQLATMFDCQWHEGPVGITTKGELCFPELQQTARLGTSLWGPFGVLDVSLCGEWILVERHDQRHPRLFLVHLPTGQVRAAGPDITCRRMSAAAWLGANRSHLHCKFKAIDMGHDRWVLISAKDQAWAIELRDSKLWLKPNQGKVRSQSASAGRFEHPFRMPGVGCQMKVAVWPDGSRVYLDSRGLLHLRSSDSTIPEATLVLVEGEIAGWSADGRVWGNTYYVGDTVNTDAGDALREIIQPFIERLSC